MGINGIAAGYFSAGHAGNKAAKAETGTGFAEKMKERAVSIRENSALSGGNARAIGQNSAVATYFTSSVHSANTVKQVYKSYQSENYKIVPDNEAECFDIYNGQGERLGAFSYKDIKVRQDAATGKQFLISEHGTMSYDALVLDEELKDDLRNAMGREEPETVELQGYTLHTHAGTGIQFLLREGEEGRGGKVLLQSAADVAKYEALAQTYFNKYPNLVHDEQAARIWADLEIKGLARRTDQGIISMGYDGMSYNDNSDYKNNWSVFFSENTYKALYAYLQDHRLNMEEMQNFSVWQDILDEIGGTRRSDR